MSRPSNEVTDLLDAWSSGDPKALDELMPVVYDELYPSEIYDRFSEGFETVDWRSIRSFLDQASDPLLPTPAS